MNSDASARVNDLFGASARDCTPGPARHMVSVLFAPVSRDTEAIRHCASVLSEGEKGRAQRFLSASREAHFKQQRAFRRYCGALAVGATMPLSSIAFELTAKGRPYLREQRGCCFSFSSCKLGFVGAWSSTHQIGVDIEDRTSCLDVVELANAYFSRAEAKAVEDAGGRTRVRTFLQLWTLKEATLKSIGEGLPFGLDAFQFELHPRIRIVDAPRNYGGSERFCAYAIEIVGGCAALAIRSGEVAP
jgi:phosphopantetheinyl transferase